MRLFKKIGAREQFKSILISLQTTSHPWLTWKDTINNRALNNNTGTIHLSNLCTEITLPQDVDNVSVCNLVSINLSQHLLDARRPAVASRSTSTRSRRARASRFASSTTSSTSPAPRSRRRTSPTTRTAPSAWASWASPTSSSKFGISYESEAAYDLIDEIMEHVSYAAIDESANLAAERGAYPNFEGSGWSKGMVPIDTIAVTEKDRGSEIKVNRTTRLDWDALRAKVKGGMRNATLMAIAPTASIGLVAGTTPGFDPQFAQIFSRATSNGKFLEVNRNLVNDLQKRGLWESTKETILRSQGDIQGIDAIPDDIKATYKTSFQLSPYAFLEVAARAQKWIDQAISRNMYLETRDLGEMMDIYFAAWERGVKTTYYLHMKPRHTAEQSTVKVNKSEELDGGAERADGVRGIHPRRPPHPHAAGSAASHPKSES